MKKEKNKRFALLTLSVIGVVSASICAYMFIRESQNKKVGRDYYTTLVSLADASAESHTYNLQDLITAPTHDAEEVEEIEEVAETETIEESEPWNPIIDFDALEETCPGIVAWIRLNNTTINYPVMQGTDNAYFLSHLPDGTPHKTGSIFMDYTNTPDFSDDNTVLYGHYISAGGMFKDLEKYKKQAFYDANPIITVHTREKDYAIIVFAGHIVSATSPFLERSFKNEDAFNTYVNEIRQRSEFVSNDQITLTSGDRLVSLITCSYEFKNARFIVTGKLIEL